MKLLAYAKLLNRKVNSAHRKATNPFYNYASLYNPFNHQINNTLVWVESDEDMPVQFKK